MVNGQRLNNKEYILPRRKNVLNKCFICGKVLFPQNKSSLCCTHFNRERNRRNSYYDLKNIKLK